MLKYFRSRRSRVADAGSRHMFLPASTDHPLLTTWNSRTISSESSVRGPPL
ncbi:MAG: hypothetical protein V7647_1795 [Acidobacteriota bacterium]